MTSLIPIYEPEISMPIDVGCETEGVQALSDPCAKLEAATLVVDYGDPESVPVFVTTRRVDFREHPTFETPSSVVKFSRKQFAMTNTSHVQLGTPSPYREDKDTVGVEVLTAFTGPDCRCAATCAAERAETRKSPI